MTAMSMDTPSRRAVLGALAGAAAALGGCGGGGGTPSTSADSTERLADDVALLWSPRIADSTDGTQWLAWVEAVPSGQQQVIAAHVSAAGAVARWPIGTAVATIASQQVVLSPTGPVVTWIEEAGAGWQLRAAAWDGRQWSIEQTWPAGASSFYGEPQLVSAVSGEVAFMWTEGLVQGGSVIRVAQRAADGSWASPNLVRTTTGYASSSQLSFDVSGNLLAAWLEPPEPPARPDAQLCWAMRGAGTASWSAVATAHSGTGFSLVRLASPAAQAWALVWAAVDPAGSVSLASKRFTAGAWETATQPIVGPAGEGAREFALDARSGVVQVAWCALAEPALSPAFIRASRFDQATGHWAPPALVFQSPTVQPVLLRLRLHADGRAALTWGYQGGDRSPWVALCAQAGQWSPSQHLDDDPVYSSNAPDVALSGDAWASAWYRYQDNGRLDVLMRRLR